MCGIGGVFTRPGVAVDPQWLQAMNETLAHRGPDGEGIFISPDRRVGLCHRRLSIVDLSENGRQPMSNEDGRLWLSFNGEIYNFLPLRKRLESKGHPFRSNTDSEVLLHLYEEEGIGMLDHLRGMFAFAIYDDREKILFCARDRIGKKPLLYAEVGEGVVFASEIPALLNTGRIDRTPDLEALGYYLVRNYRHIPEPLSIFKQIRKLEPAHYLIIRDGKAQEPKRYWTPSFDPLNGDPIENVRRTVEEAVRIRQIADVEVGALLSGGVDSSIIVGLASENGRREIRTYSLGLNQNDGELQRARFVSKLFKTKHQEFYFDEQQLSIVDLLVERLGEPIYLLPLTHNYVLFSRIREDGIKAVLAGHGGDELFYGYDWSNRALLASYLFRVFDKLPSRIREGLMRLSGERNTTAGMLLALACVENSRRKGLVYRTASRELPGLFHPRLKEALKEFDFGRVPDRWSEQCRSPYYIDAVYYTALMSEHAHSLTIASDLPAMACSVEVRAPFLDQEVMELAFCLNPRMKVRPLITKRSNKYALKKAFAHLIPREILYAPKQGFGHYIREQDLTRGVWRRKIEEKIFGNAMLDSYFNLPRLKPRWLDHCAGRTNDSHLFMKLYALAAWQERYGS